MRILLNGKETVVPDGVPVAWVLGDMGLGRRAAVIINGEKLLQKEYPERILEEGDTLRIIRPLAGG